VPGFLQLPTLLPIFSGGILVPLSGAYAIISEVLFSSDFLPLERQVVQLFYQ
jgi:hypothetical protein